MSNEKDEGQEAADNYKVNSGAVKKVDELLNRDKDDESLKKWKEALLGKSAANVYSPKDDPRRVVVTEFAIICKDRPGGDIVFKIDSQDALTKLKDSTFVLKEGSLFKKRIKIRVQHELVTGLKYQNVVSRLGFKDKDVEVMGSFAPQAEPHEVTIPRKQWDETPSGMLLRGSYAGEIKLIDDDDQCHLEFKYSFKIEKDW